MRWIAVASLLALAGCTCASGVDGLQFFCAADAECGPGFVCRLDQCVEAAPQGGDGGAGTDGGSSGDAGCASTIEICNDGQDNNCDGRVDCGDFQCLGFSCGSNGMKCDGVACACSGNGGTAQTPEVLCADNADNDCDGLADCADSSCEGLFCGGTKQCLSGACLCILDGGTVEATEQSCADGLDNDCDGQVDCADSNCLSMACDGTRLAAVCCGAVCTDLATDKSNCGGCGQACGGPSNCSPVTVNSIYSGRCMSCGNNNHCPGSQRCTASTCACTGAQDCVSGQACTLAEGLTDPGWCHY